MGRTKKTYSLTDSTLERIKVIADYYKIYDSYVIDQAVEMYAEQFAKEQSKKAK